MGMFDGQGVDGPAPTSAADMVRSGARGLGRALLDPMMESQGFISKENRIMDAMKGVNLEDAKSVSDTFNKIMMISPEAAAEFQKQVMPMLEANQTASTKGGVLGDQLKTSAFILNCDLKDPECRKKAYAHAKDYKRMNEYTKASAINQADDLKLVLETARTAKEEDARYNQMLDILPDIWTGTGSEWVSGPVNRIADFFGIDNTAGKREVFASNAMNMALGYIAQTKGAVSDREFDAFQNATANLKKTKAGNELIIKTAQQYSRWRQKRAAEMTRWTTKVTNEGGTPTQAMWATHELEWAAKPENLVKLPTDSEINAALKPSSKEQEIGDAELLDSTEQLLRELEQ
jgi:hypothetical protein